MVLFLFACLWLLVAASKVERQWDECWAALKKVTCEDLEWPVTKDMFAGGAQSWASHTCTALSQLAQTAGADIVRPKAGLATCVTAKASTVLDYFVMSSKLISAITGFHNQGSGVLFRRLS